MLQTGTLRTWNDDRGFGFITPTQGGEKVFMHISAFSHDGTRPTVGEKMSFLLGSGHNGKPQAIKVMRAAVVEKARAAKVVAKRRPRPSTWIGSLLLIALMVGGIAVGYGKYKAYEHQLALEKSLALPALSLNDVGFARTLRCDARTMCFQMTSCAEAQWITNSCSGTRMDGNHDASLATSSGAPGLSLNDWPGEP